MNGHRPTWALRQGLVFAVAMLLSGCAFSNAMDRGEDAMRAANYDSAVYHFTRATRLDPDDQEAQRRLVEAKAAAVDVRLQASRDALMRGELVVAARGAGEAERLLPDHVHVAELVRDVKASVLATGRKEIAGGHHAGARYLYADVMAVLPDPDGTLMRADAEAVDAWLADLRPRRDAALKAKRLGDALLMHRQVLALSPSAVDRAQCQQLKTSLRAQHEVVLVQRQLADVGGHRGDRRDERDGRGAERRFTGLARSLAFESPNIWLRVASPDDTRTKGTGTLGFTLSSPRLDVRHDVEIRTAEYQSGTRPVPNPHHINQRRDVDEAERRVLEAEQEVTRIERDVSRYEADVQREGPSPDTTTSAEAALDNARRRLDDARRALTDRRRDLQNERDELQRTPPFVAEPVFSTHSFEVRRYAAFASSTLTSVVDWPAKNGTPTSLPLTLEAFDETFADQPIIGLPGDPMTLPSEEELRHGLVQAARAELERVIQGAFAQAVQAQRARAMALNGDARMDALVVYLLMDPGITDPEVDELIGEVRGIPGASVLLDTCEGP